MAKYIKVFISILFVFSTLNALEACTYVINKNVIQPTCGSNGIISFSMTPPPNNGASFKVYKNNSFLVQINGSIANLNSLTPGVYKVVVADNQTGCIDSLDNIVLDPSANSLSATYKMDSTRCDTSFNGKITLTLANAVIVVNKPITYKWRKGITDIAESDSIAENLTTGIYHVTITDGADCRYEIADMKVVERQGKMRIIDTIIKPTSCDSPIGIIKLNYEGLHLPKFIWRQGTGTNYPVFDSINMPLDSLAPGKYTCYFTDTLACYPLIVKDLEIVKNPPPKAVIFGTDSLCLDQGFGYLDVKILKGDSTQMTYKWNPGQTTKRIDGVPSGSYFVTVTDAAGCIDTPKWTIYDYTPRYVNLIADKDELVKGGETFIKIDTTIGLYNIRWYSNPVKQFDSLSDSFKIRARPTVNALYTMKAKYGPGCETVATKAITIVEPKDDIEKTNIPNIFTPNGDGRNEVYKLLAEDNTIKSFEINVFDRWGNIVFAAYDQKFEWNGVSLKGEPVISGVYTYILKYTKVDAPFDRKIKTGTILIER